MLFERVRDFEMISLLIFRSDYRTLGQRSALKSKIWQLNFGCKTTLFKTGAHLEVRIADSGAFIRKTVFLSRTNCKYIPRKQANFLNPRHIKQHSWSTGKLPDRIEDLHWRRTSDRLTQTTVHFVNRSALLKSL